MRLSSASEIERALDLGVTACSWVEERTFHPSIRMDRYFAAIAVTQWDLRAIRVLRSIGPVLAMGASRQIAKSRTASRHKVLNAEIFGWASSESRRVR